MSSLTIRCPETGRPVPTGIELDPNVFRQLPNVPARMRCPACGREHIWTMEVAWLAGELRLVRPPATEAA